MSTEQNARKAFQRVVIEPHGHSNEMDSGGTYVQPGLESAWHSFMFGYFAALGKEPYR